MATETEMKFLVAPNWRDELDSNTRIVKSFDIKQAYLASSKECVVRVRTNSTDMLAYITIKGPKIGLSCPEFEYQIPYEDALEMIKMCPLSLEKTRNVVIDGEKQIWEVDEFSGLNEGLVVAEIEMESEDADVIVQTWIGKEVSSDSRYANANLIHTAAPKE